MGYAKWHFHHSDIDFTISRESKGPFAYLMNFPFFFFLFFFAFQLHWELLEFGFLFWLTNLFEVNFPPAHGVPLLLSVWHFLHLSCWLLSFPVFTCIHLIPLRTSTQGEICNFKSRNLPFFLSPLFLTASHLFSINASLPALILSAFSYLLYLQNPNTTFLNVCIQVFFTLLRNVGRLIDQSCFLSPCPRVVHIKLTLLFFPYVIANFYYKVVFPISY